MRRALAVLATAAALAPGARRAPRLTASTPLRPLAGAALAAALSIAQPASARPPSPSVWQASYADQLHPGCERKISIEKNGDRVIAHFAGAGTASLSTPFISTKDRVDGVPWSRNTIAAPPSPRRLDGDADGVGASLTRLRHGKRPTPSPRRRDAKTAAGTDVGPKGIGDKVFLACSPDNVEKYKLRTWAFDGEIVGDRIDAGDGVHAGTWNVNFKGAENPWTGIRWKDGNRWLKLEEE